MFKVLLHHLNVVTSDSLAELFCFFFVPGPEVNSLVGEESGKCGEGQGLPDLVGIIFHTQKAIETQEEKLKIK